MAIIVNLKDSGGIECTCEGCSSWLEHWELCKEVNAIYCRACITKTNLQGTHVKRPDSTEQYIVPLCYTCSEKEGELDIWSYKELASATCFHPVKHTLKPERESKP
jgi:hypothetical protein